MATLQLYLVAFTLFCSVLGGFVPYDYGFDIARHVVRRQSPLVVRGEAGRGVVLRQEVRQLEQDADVWTLYLLGLNLMQSTDQSVPTSWYGLTGIHGIPHKTWGGVGPVPGSESTGYCTHSSVLFPTWHRPYLVLYEQTLISLIERIANTWPEGEERDRYTAAARRFRIPYWDWAITPPSGQSVLPLSVGGSAYVNVNGPVGSQRISNPLYSYTFKPLNATAFLQRPWNIWTSTLRAPTTNDDTAQSNNSLIARNLDHNLSSLSQRLYILFSNYRNYTTFSNNAFIGVDNASYDSLESLHDTVHNLAGGGGQGQPNAQGGHMSYIPYSAFDPIFFLHHTNVDRIFAMWQAGNPQAWIQPQPARMPSYTTYRGQIQDSSTFLTPFFADENGSFWTSDGIRDHTRFGYTYADLGIGPNISRRATANVRKAINRLYGGSSAASLFMKANSRISGGNQPNGKQTDSSGLTRGVVFTGDRYREWIVNVRVRKQAIPEPFSVHVFLGDVPSDPQQWSLTKSHIGMVGVFSSDEFYGMSTGQLDVSGTVPLTTSLINKVIARELASLEPRDVKKYLGAKLCRRVLGVSGKIYDVSQVKGLVTEVVSSVVKAPATEEELPEWGRVQSHFQMR
ncbi:hypothetical protein B0T16DRAFT_434124 [Cercophora newfieldiana]|uniref:Tyrosinase copper-binding domain-containing protein n=1 Tax=Cercophora newfieldiana TaxID=92897 RepID=A0AA39YTE5_9PEZI|nr:hypothetical protein B0T16DRAFT_434124 [Cercophora newfieldiana]